MSQSKIEFRLGDMHFMGEGDKEWVTKQLDKIISKAPSLIGSDSGAEENNSSYEEISSRGKSSGKRKTAPGKKTNKSVAKPHVTGLSSNFSGKDLSPFIQSKKAGSNQRIKFLATAVWLTKKGKNNLVTRDISKALKDARVPALINPSQYLNQNVKQGYLKRSGDHFSLTKKGSAAL